jgi:hypothetical protein
MRKHILSSLALLTAVTISAFSGNQAPGPKYYVYNGGFQNLPTNYVIQSTQPSTCWNNNVLCWLKVTDMTGNTPGSSPDGDVDDFDFTYWFEHHDNNNNNSLNDDAEIAGWVEKKF